MLYSDLREVRKILELDDRNTQEDAKLNFFISQASEWISEFLGRGDIGYKERTEYYNGSGTAKLLLRQRPVFATPTIQVWIDTGGYWGSVSGSFDSNDALTYGTDFALQIDQDDGISSRCGILWARKRYWPRPSVRQQGYLSPFIGQDHGSIKITYWAGYTVDALPEAFRTACNTLVARMRYLFPLGMELGSEGFEDRSIGLLADRKDYLMALVKPLIFTYRNWKW